MIEVNRFDSFADFVWNFLGIYFLEIRSKKAKFCKKSYGYLNCDMYKILIIACVLQKSNKPYEKHCGLDCYKNYTNSVILTVI